MTGFLISCKNFQHINDFIIEMILKPIKKYKKGFCIILAEAFLGGVIPPGGSSGT